jgi:uncharacterized protein (TIGR02453 family)
LFPGFPTEGLTFLRGLIRNNDRDWFQPRKHIFEKQLKDPMLALCEEINGELAKFGPDYITDPKKALFRIYRDTRFSNDKTPYKTRVAAVFRWRGEKAGSAMLYVAIAPKGVTVAGGVYDPEPAHLLAIRTWLAENHREFRKAAQRPEKLVGALRGDTLQRIPKGFPADHPASDLIKMKRWIYDATLDPKLATSPKLLKEVSTRFRIMLPVLELLNEPVAKSKKASAMSAGMFPI